jgi:hypothetical protein
MACPSLDALAAEFAPRGFTSLFIYTREAHPGELLPHHTSFAQKMAHARRFRDGQRVQRRILVDALDGTVHQCFGALPNMTWILLRGGLIAYKAAWTDAEDVHAAMENVSRIVDLRRRGGRLAPFWTERLGFRTVDQAAFDAGLERNGPKAVNDFSSFTSRVPLDRLEEE